MPAVRTHNSNQNAEASSSKTKTKPRHKSRIVQEKETTVPGVQKLKAALRQTRRLLAKDKLSADVRVETERRLKALEAELQHAEQANRERALAVRYHKIKFFERQKVTRKIKQTQKVIQSTESKKEKKKATAELQELRVDLNYILHYPKTKKYISLFPPEVRNGEEPKISEEDVDKTKADREVVRTWIREQMTQNALSSEPELETNATSSPVKTRTQKWLVGDKSNSGKTKATPVDNEEQDEFFGEDD